MSNNTNLNDYTNTDRASQTRHHHSSSIREEAERKKLENFKEQFASPKQIFALLQQYVYGQDEACKAAAEIVWSHVHQLDKNSRSLFVGPSGCGKTYIFQIIAEHIFPNIIFVNAATLTREGWNGNTKISTVLSRLNLHTNDAIIVLDEFDKFCSPSHSSHGDNVSASLQNELLTLIYPSDNHYCITNKDGSSRQIRLDKITWVMAGSFADVATKIAENNSSYGLGFMIEKKSARPYEHKIDTSDIIKAGVIPEVAGRFTRIVNLNPLTKSDYVTMLIQNNGPIHQLEKMYRLKHGFIEKKIIPVEEMCDMAISAFESGLGVRALSSQIQCRVEDYLYEHSEDSKPVPCVFTY